MRGSAILIILLALAGCARGNPVSNKIDQNPDFQSKVSYQVNDPHMLWGEWTWYIEETHENIDVVPKRAGRFHLNALKFLEEYCSDCLQITKIVNNGDSTIDLTVKITHPFHGHPEYTGFDVKGIIMFDGSWVADTYPYYPPHPDDYLISWRILGDPQLLNADGYTLRWSPLYESGSTQPIFNYWEGKYANGTPTANLNGFLNFYTDENRHMFRDDGIVTRTYKIWLPPGEPVVAGYAVEALWVPPDVMPVTDPMNDFPISANQSEPYEFNVVLNEGKVITDDQCCSHIHENIYFPIRQWGEFLVNPHMAYYTDYVNFISGWGVYSYEPEWPNHYGNTVPMSIKSFPEGDHIGVAVVYGLEGWPVKRYDHAYDVFEFTIDYE